MKRLPELIAAAASWIEKQAQPLPEFDLRVGLATDFGEIVAGEAKEVPLSTVLALAIGSGRALVSGPAGSGKTVALRRLFKASLRSEAATFWTDFSRWTPIDVVAWEKLAGNDERLSWLLSKCTPSTSRVELDALPIGTSRVFFFDGLNEVSSELGQKVLFLLDEFVTVTPHTSVIVSDRMTRREFRRPERWNLMCLLPLPDAEIARHVPKNLIEKAPRLPILLDAFLKGEAFDTLLERLRLSPEQATKLCQAALLAYQESGARVFDAVAFELAASSPTVAALKEAGLLHVKDGLGFFNHHMLHDFLVAKRLVDTGTWDYDTLTSATLKASSFDVLVLAAERLPADSLERFVREIYDWNMYGSAHVVSDSRVQPRISADLLTALTAMLGERSLDQMAETAQRAHDALLRLGTPLSRRLSNAKTLADILGEIAGHQLGASFTEWKRIFLIPDGDTIADADLRRIEEDNSLVGWAVSNVVKRLRLSELQQQFLRSLIATHKSPVVRWRSAHAIGVFPTSDSLQVLHAVALKDPQMWVRYGAVRSMVELAVSAPSRQFRATVIAKVRDVMASRPTDDKVIRECARVLRMVRPPEGWATDVSVILKDLSEREPSAERREEFERLAYRLRHEQTLAAREA